MRIIYYSSNPHLPLNANSGPGTHMREMIEAFRELGHEVLPVIMAYEVITLDSSKIKTSALSIKSIAKVIIPKFVWRSIKEYRLIQYDKKLEVVLRAKINEFKPDIVYERAAYLQASGVNVLKHFNIKHYIEINAPLYEEVTSFEGAFSFFKSKAIKIEKALVNLPDKVFVVSSALKEYYSNYLSNNNKIIVTPNCVNPSKIIINHILKDKIISDYKLNGKTIIGFVGSIFPYHGVDILIKAFSKLVIENDNIMLIIVGDGIILNDLKTLSNELDVIDKIIFTGKVNHEDVFSYIDLMDITIMAKSNWYGSPVKIFEYGIMRKAIIAPNTIPVKDVMIDRVDGILIEPNEKELLEALKELLNNEKLREQIAINFYNKVAQSYSWVYNAMKVLG